MTARTVVLVRHGRTAWNATGRLQGHADIALDDVGRWQARRGAQTLFRRHRAALVVSSDLARAAQTAQAYADAAGVPVVLDARLRERGFGQWEGLTGEELIGRWPEQYAAWRRGEEPTGIGAETKAAVAARMVEAVRAHAEGLDADQTLAVVSHGAAISLAVAALLGQDASYWRGIAGLNNVHWSHLARATPGATPDWRLVTHNAGPDYPLDEWNAGPADLGDDADWISAPGSA